MKKLHFNSTLNHKASDYKPCEICVERVVTLYGKSFEQLKVNAPEYKEKLFGKAGGR